MRKKAQAEGLLHTIHSSVGIGIVIFLQALVGMPVSLAGTIPLLVGVGLLAYPYVLAPRH